MLVSIDIRNKHVLVMGVSIATRNIHASVIFVSIAIRNKEIKINKNTYIVDISMSA